MQTRVNPISLSGTIGRLGSMASSRWGRMLLSMLASICIHLSGLHFALHKKEKIEETGRKSGVSSIFVKMAMLEELKARRAALVEKLKEKLHKRENINISDYLIESQFLEINIKRLKKGERLINEDKIRRRYKRILKWTRKIIQKKKSLAGKIEAIHYAMHKNVLMNYHKRQGYFVEVVLNSIYNCFSSTQLFTALMGDLLPHFKNYGLIVFDDHSRSWVKIGRRTYEIENTDGRRPRKRRYSGRGMRTPKEIMVAGYLLENGVKLEDLPEWIARYYRMKRKPRPCPPSVSRKKYCGKKGKSGGTGADISIRLPSVGERSGLPDPPDHPIPNPYFGREEGAKLGVPSYIKTTLGLDLLRGLMFRLNDEKEFTLNDPDKEMLASFARLPKYDFSRLFLEGFNYSYVPMYSPDRVRNDLFLWNAIFNIKSERDISFLNGNLNDVINLAKTLKLMGRFEVAWEKAQKRAKKYLRAKKRLGEEIYRREKFSLKIVNLLIRCAVEEKKEKIEELRNELLKIMGRMDLDKQRLGGYVFIAFSLVADDQDFEIIKSLLNTAQDEGLFAIAAYSLSKMVKNRKKAVQLLFEKFKAAEKYTQRWQLLILILTQMGYHELCLNIIFSENQSSSGLRYLATQNRVRLSNLYVNRLLIHLRSRVDKYSLWQLASLINVLFRAGKQRPAIDYALRVLDKVPASFDFPKEIVSLDEDVFKNIFGEQDNSWKAVFADPDKGDFQLRKDFEARWARIKDSRKRKKLLSVLQGNRELQWGIRSAERIKSRKLSKMFLKNLDEAYEYSWAITILGQIPSFEIKEKLYSLYEKNNKLAPLIGFVLAKTYGKLPKDLSADLVRIVYNKNNFHSAKRAYVYAATALMLAGESSLLKLI